MPLIARSCISEFNNEPPWGRFNKAGALVLQAVLLFSLFFFLTPRGLKKKKPLIRFIILFIKGKSSVVWTIYPLSWCRSPNQPTVHYWGYKAQNALWNYRFRAFSLLPQEVENQSRVTSNCTTFEFKELQVRWGVG